MTIFNFEMLNVPFASGAISTEIAPFPDWNRGLGIAFEQSEGKPEMKGLNGLFQVLTTSMLYLKQRGISEWDSALDYPANAFVTEGAKLYKSKRTNTAKQPSLSQLDWDVWASISDISVSTNGNLKKTVAADGSVTLEVPTASDSQRGAVRQATSAEVANKSNVNAYVTPANALSIVSSSNSASATKLATARTINGVSFDGAANISVEAESKFHGYLRTTSALDGAIASGLYGVSELSVAGLYNYGTMRVYSFGTTITQVYYAHNENWLGSTAIRQTWNGSLTGVSWRILDNPNPATAITATNCSRSIVAGNGLLGGGDLTANRTLTLGTPGTVTASTGNTVSASSHTHNLDVGSLPLLGVGQTWQNVTGSRSLDVTYTNNTGKPIQVMLTVINSSLSQQASFQIGSVTVASLRDGENERIQLSAIIPSGNTYRLNGPCSIIIWAELR